MKMAGYTKLFNSILASTIWRADDKTRIVWITLLAMADKNGVAEGSVPGLADLARVSIEDCEAALAELMAPDPYSRTTDYEGRRIENVDGGWLLLNHAKYRAKMSADDIREKNRIRQEKWRERHKDDVTEDVTENNASSRNVTDGHAKSRKSRKSRHTKAQADTKAEEEKNLNIIAPSAVDEPSQVGPQRSLPKDLSSSVSEANDHLPTPPDPEKIFKSTLWKFQVEFAEPTTKETRIACHQAIAKLWTLAEGDAQLCIEGHRHFQDAWRTGNIDWPYVHKNFNHFLRKRKPTASTPNRPRARDLHAAIDLEEQG